MPDIPADDDRAVSSPKKPSLPKALGRYLGQSLRLMVGIPDYPTYLRHMAKAHPDKMPMSYEAFFRERQQARYGAGMGRCC